MNRQINNVVVLSILLIALTSIVGCASSKPNLFAGWNFCWSQDPADLNKAIQADFQDYIGKLPEKERRYVLGDCISLFEDGKGGHAVKIEIPLRGVYIVHVLFYDKGNSRVKVITFHGSRFAS